MTAVAAPPAVRERPILFSGPMVRAILEGRKTQTRRVVKPQPPEGSRVAVGVYAPTIIARNGDEEPGADIFGAYSDEGDWGAKCPYGAPGDRLWVRETSVISPPSFDGVRSNSYNVTDRNGEGRICQYLASTPDWEAARGYGLKPTPSIFMPRWASRLTLAITDVRVQRVQEISEDDAWAEGSECRCPTGNSEFDACTFDGPDHFAMLWDSLNAARGHGWDVNPWVWAITFEVTK